jgi:hypothetical protein
LSLNPAENNFFDVYFLFKLIRKNLATCEALADFA